MQTVTVYTQQNATTKLLPHQDLDWEWTKITQNEDMDKVVVGDQVVAIPTKWADNYALFYPIRHGRLNVVQGRVLGLLQ